MVKGGAASVRRLRRRAGCSLREPEDTIAGHLPGVSIDEWQFTSHHQRRQELHGRGDVPQRWACRHRRAVRSGTGPWLDLYLRDLLLLLLLLLRSGGAQREQEVGEEAGWVVGAALGEKANRLEAGLEQPAMWRRAMSGEGHGTIRAVRESGLIVGCNAMRVPSSLTHFEAIA